MKQQEKKKCYRNIGDCIEGDQIRVECMKVGKWKLIRKSGQHKGQLCKAEKDARATILRTYTNIKC